MSERKSDHWEQAVESSDSFSSSPAAANGQSKQLGDKVVLIVGLASEGSCHLAVVLAEMGSDIAIVYYRDAYEAAQRVSEQVEALGRRCLAITNTSSSYLAQEVVEQVIAAFGRLDVFISYPPQVRVDPATLTNGQVEENGGEYNAQRRLYRSLVFPNFSLMKAALNQIIIE